MDVTISIILMALEEGKTIQLSGSQWGGEFVLYSFYGKLGENQDQTERLSLIILCLFRSRMLVRSK